MDRIALDQQTLKALAGETRVRILKLLDKKQMTQSDLADALKMSLPTVGEHLKALESADLVSREQTDRKWKYYSATQKTRLLLHPHTSTIWFVLGLFLFSAAATVINAVRYFAPVAQAETLAFAAPMAKAAAEESADAAGASLMSAAPELAQMAAPAAQSPLWFVVFGAATLVLLIALVVLMQKHGWLGKSLSNKKNI